MIAVEYHADLKEVQSDARLSALLSDKCQSAPFDRFEWWQGLESSCAMEPLIVTARNAGAIAVLPLCRNDDQLEALANWYTFRFRPLISAECDARPLLLALAGDLAEKTHRLTLCGIPDEDGSASMLEEAFSATGWTVLREQCDTNHVLFVKGRNWDEYFETLPGRLRSTIKRKGKKLDCRIITDFDGKAWDNYEAIYAASWKPEEGSIQFLRAFAQAEGAAGRLRLGIACQDGEPIAAQVWTVEGGTAYIHKLAYREKSKGLSPGSVLSAAMFRHVIETDKVGLIDYGTGDDAYKRDWMEEVRPRFRLDIFRPEAPKNWFALAKLSLQRLAATDKRV